MSDPDRLRELVQWYADSGFAILPIAHASKAPRFPSWQKIRDASLADEVTANVGIGLEASNLTDVDLDCPEAVEVAPFFVVPTAAFGRASKPLSHYIYRGRCKSAKFLSPADKSCLIEVRCAGQQTVFPPSVHPSGETIEWANDLDMVDAPDTIHEIAALIASASLLVRHAPARGSRHDFALAIGGALARAGWDEDQIDRFVRPVFTVARFADLDRHCASAKGSVVRVLNGEAVTGWSTVAEILGPEGTSITRALRSWLGDTGARGRIAVPMNLPLTDQIDRVVEALSHTETYQKAGKLVGVRRDVSLIDGKYVPLDNPQIWALPLQNVEERIDQVAQFIGIDEQGHEVPVKAPPGLAQKLFVRGEWSHVRPIVGVVGYPFLRPDWTICTSGYDEATRVLCTNTEILSVSEAPSKDEALEALALLREPFCDVCFSDPIAESAAISFLLTLIARYAIGNAPLFVFDANIERSGKTLLATTLAGIAIGREVGTAALSTHEDEIRKALFSIARAGSPLSIFDNIKGRIESAALEAAITSGVVSDRILGESEIVELPCKSVFAITSNNATLSTDLIKRSIAIRLHSPEERPEHRQGFRYRLPAVAIDARKDLLAAAFTILRAYDVAGRPTQLPALGSFTDWTQTVAAPLVWLGMPNPIDSQIDFAAGADTITEPLIALLETMREIYDEPQTVGAIVADDRLRPAFSEMFGERFMTARYVSEQFRKLRLRNVGGMCLDREYQGKTKTYRWFVRSAEERENDDGISSQGDL